MLRQTILNAEFASKGSPVAHIVIDGAVDVRPILWEKCSRPENFQQLREKPQATNMTDLMLPAPGRGDLPPLAQQHRSTLTFEIDLRAFSDRPWWNHWSNSRLNLRVLTHLLNWQNRSTKHDSNPTNAPLNLPGKTLH